MASSPFLRIENPRDSIGIAEDEREAIAQGVHIERKVLLLVRPVEDVLSIIALKSADAESSRTVWFFNLDLASSAVNANGGAVVGNVDWFARDLSLAHRTQRLHLGMNRS